MHTLNKTKQTSNLQTKKQLEKTAQIVSKAMLRKPVDESIKRRQIRYTKKILRDPLIFSI